MCRCTSLVADLFLACVLQLLECLPASWPCGNTRKNRALHHLTVRFRLTLRLLALATHGHITYYCSHDPSSSSHVPSKTYAFPHKFLFHLPAPSSLRLSLACAATQRLLLLVLLPLIFVVLGLQSVLGLFVVFLVFHVRYTVFWALQWPRRSGRYGRGGVV